MNLNKKIEAFTISEMIVVLILTSIVVGLAFSILTIVQNHIKAIQKNLDFTIELNKLEQSLNIDFNRYSTIQYDEPNQALILSNEMFSKSYFFKENYIVKDLDTFHIELSKKQFFFDGADAVNGYIDAVKLTTSQPSQNQTIFVFMQNDATLYME